jgi:hypothetical protein
MTNEIKPKKYFYSRCGYNEYWCSKEAPCSFNTPEDIKRDTHFNPRTGKFEEDLMCKYKLLKHPVTNLQTKDMNKEKENAVIR